MQAARLINSGFKTACLHHKWLAKLVPSRVSLFLAEGVTMLEVLDAVLDSFALSHVTMIFAVALVVVLLLEM